MMRRLLTLLSCLLVGLGALQAQDITASGVVLDESGMEVIGATVVLKGTKVGAATGIDGDFTLKVPEGSTLVFSMVGMKPVEQKAKTNMKVVMGLDEQLLDEVMVVAYGTAKKSQFTGSATVVGAKAISESQSVSPIEALKGRVTGVQINTASGQPGLNDPTIRIRGISSINAGSAPLIVVDGAPYDGTLNSINNNDIESMTVLKDAASSALYGARGANGVIIITTKKGKEGKAQVTFDMSFGALNRASRDYDTVNDPGSYYEMYYGAYKSYLMSGKNPLSSDAAHTQVMANMFGNGSFGLGYNVYSVPNGESVIGADGKLNSNATLGNVVSYKDAQYKLTPDNWLDAAYKNGFKQEYNFTVSGATEKSSFYSSVNYLNMDGIVDNSGFERISTRLNSDFQVNDWFKFGAKMDYSHYNIKSNNFDGTSNSSGNVFAIASRIAPIYPLFMRDGDGNIMISSDGLTRYDYGGGANGGSLRPFLGNSNAIDSNILDLHKNTGNTFNTNFFGEVRFLNDFKFTSTNTIAVVENNKTETINPYFGLTATTNGQIEKSNIRRYSYLVQQLFTYSKQVGKNNFDVLLGHEYNRQRYYTLSATKTNQFDPSNTELAGAINLANADSYSTDYNIEGYFSRLQYDYDSKYFGSFSFRRDGSSRFDPDNKWGNFWSFGGAWLIDKEDFYNIPWLNMLKLKASYGEQGNDQIGNFKYTNTYNIVNSSGVPAVIPDVMGNKNITWETQHNFNIGAEFEILKGKLGGSIEYFNRSTSDMLNWFSLAPSFGFTGYWDNIGDMRNRGFEIDLYSTPYKMNDLTIDLRANITFVRNKITKIPDKNKTMVVDGISGYSSGNKFYGEGKSMYTYHLRSYAGVDQETGLSLFYKNVKDTNGNVTGRITTTDYSEADYYLADSSLPSAYGGFGTTVTYKGFDLGFDFAYQLGGKVYDSDYAAFMTSPISTSRGTAFHQDLVNAWTPENHTDTPRMQFGDLYTSAASDRFLTSASYLSLQNINAGYTFSSRICNSIGLQKLRVYFSADNVFLWSKRKGMDPRQNVDGSTTSSYYSPIRTLTGGLSVTF